MTDLSDSTKLVYKAKHKIRFVTAASLFDGHDASINIMRRILQASGAEVIHLGHNRSVDEIVTAALQEDVQGIAISSYQGGHLEFFKYMIDLLRSRGGAHIRVFGGGGGVIVPDEIKELHDYGVARIYSPEDGQRMGLQGMINDMLARCDFDLAQYAPKALKGSDPRLLAQVITALELGALDAAANRQAAEKSTAPVLGVTGTGGAGKSSLTDELVRRFRLDQGEDLGIAVLSVDPTRRKTGGALLGDRIRMNAIHGGRTFMRSLATRETGGELSAATADAIAACKAAGYQLVIVETAGIGPGDAAIVPHADVTLYVMTPEFGAASQLEKIDMLDFADLVAINKFDRKGAEDALRDVRKQGQRTREGARGGWRGGAEAGAAHPRGVRRAGGFHAGVRHDRRALQRRRCHRALPRARRRPRLQGTRACATAVAGPAERRVLERACHHPGEASALPRRDRRHGARLPRDRAEPVAARARAPAAPGHAGHAGYRGAGARQADRAEGGRARPGGQGAHRALAGDGEVLFGRRAGGEGARQGDPHPAHQYFAFRHQSAEGGAAALRVPRRAPALAHAGEPARRVPLHGGRVPLQARERGSNAHVRG